MIFPNAGIALRELRVESIIEPFMKGLAFCTIVGEKGESGEESLSSFLCILFTFFLVDRVARLVRAVFRNSAAEYVDSVGKTLQFSYSCYREVVYRMKINLPDGLDVFGHG